MKHVPVAAFKDRVSEYIAEAATGEEIIITRHGKPAARLISAEDDDERKSRTRAALDALQNHRERMLKEGRTATADEIKSWINEGRP
jgi:prevent-host-death family protein